MSNVKEFVAKAVAAKLNGESQVQLWLFIQFGKDKSSLGHSVSLTRERAMEIARSNITYRLIEDDHLKGKKLKKAIDKAMCIMFERGNWTHSSGQIYVVESRPLQ